MPHFQNQHGDAGMTGARKAVHGPTEEQIAARSAAAPDSAQPAPQSLAIVAHGATLVQDAPPAETAPDEETADEPATQDAAAPDSAEA